MTGRARSGLHLVEDGDAQAAEPNTPVLPDVPGRPLLSLRQQSVVLAIGGRLNADTAGRLRLFLSMFTVAGGPQQLVLDLSDVFAVDEDGMAPVFEAEEAMRLRMACLRLTSESAAIAGFLDDVRWSRTLTTCRAPVLDGELGGPALDDGRPRRGQD
jgi:anti-anti-sigma regulatory factor